MKRFYKFLLPLVAIVAMAMPWTAQAQNACPIKIVGADGFADGWNGGSLTVVQNGVTLATFTAANADNDGMGTAYDSIQVVVSDDSAITFVWSAGDYDDEVAIWIYNARDSLMFTVSEPNVGTIYTMQGTDVNCPDCSQPVNLTASVTGSDVNLAWTQGNASSWQIVWGTGTFNPDTVQVNIDYSSTGTYSFVGLADGLYNAYVRADCGTETSAWTPVSFMIGGCMIRVEGQDSYGDGWNGGSLAVVQGGATVYTVNMTSGSTITANIPVTSTPAVSFVWSTGSYDSEVSFTIYDGGGAAVYTGSYPTAGTVYTLADPCPTCLVPSGLTVDSITPTEITIHWTPGQEEAEWNVYYGDTVIMGITDTFFTATGLEQYTVYSFGVQAICGDGDTSGVSTAVSARTTVSCPWPTGLTATYLGQDTIIVAWNAGGEEGSWEVAIGNETPVEVNDSTYTFDGLNPNTPYTIKVRAICDVADISAWTTITVRTACGDITTLPFSENFDGYASSSYPPCWTRVTSGSHPYVTSSYGNSLVFAGTAGAIAPLIQVLPSQMVVSFDLQVESTSSSGTMTFGYTTNPNSLDSMVAIAVITPSTTNTYYHYEYDLSLDTAIAALTEPVYLCWRQNGSTSWYYWLDNVLIEQANDCSKPDNFVVTSTNPDSVAVQWNEMGTATNWQLYVGPAGSTPDEDSVIYCTSTSYVFNNLTAGVAYDMYVRADCGDGTSNWRGPLAVTPGSYNIGVSGSSTITMCGGAIYDDGGATGDYSANVEYSLTVYPSSPDSMLTFHGSAYLESSSWDRLKIFEGVGTSGNILWENANTSAVTMQIPLDTCVSGPITINFHSDGSGQYGGFELFIACVGAPECSPVESLTVHPTPTAALVTWQPGFYGVYSGATVEYKADSMETWSSLPMTTGNYVVIPGLDPTTDYNVRVTTDCDGFQGGVATANFTTTDFGCAVIDSASTFNDTIANGSATNSYIPSYSLYNYSLSQQIYTAAEIGHGGAISTIAFKASNIQTASRTLEIYMGHTTSATATSYLNPSDVTLVYSGTPTLVVGWNTFDLTTPFNYDGTQNLIVIVRDMSGSWSSSNTWIGAESTSGVSRYIYQDDGPYNIGTSGGTSSSFRCATIFAGSGCLQHATCAAPAVAVMEITTTSVTVAWAPGATETSWNAYYRVAGTTTWSTPVTVTGSTYTFAGLASGTNYEFMLENACSEGNFATSVEAATLCAPITLPYTEDFNGWGTGVLPNCWYNTGAYYTTSYSIITSAQNMTGTTGGSVYMYTTSGSSYTSRIILPELDTTVNQMNQAQLVFNVMYNSTSYGAPSFVVGVMSDPNNLSTFVPVDTVTVGGGINQWEVFEVSFAGYTGNGTHVAIQTNYQSNYFYCYLDDVTLEAIPTCPRPDSLSVSNAGTTTVDLAWRERGNASQWIVEYGPRGFQLGTGTQVVANTNPFTLTGIPSSYQGEYYVKSICGAGDTGEYSRRACAFNTTQIPATLPYSYDFENSAEWDNWQTCSYNSTNWYRGTAVADSGMYSMYISIDSGATYSPYQYNAVVNATAYRDVDFGPVDSSFTMTIRARAGGSTDASYDGMIVILADPSIPTVASSQNLMTPWGDVRDLYQILDVRIDTTWQTYSCSFDTIHGVQRVAFYWVNQNTQSSHPTLTEPVAVDNITIDYSSCPRPVDLDTVSVGGTTATLTWVGAPNANYEVIYRIPNTPNQYATTNTNSITLTGLNTATTYYAWVRKLCGAGDTSLVSDGIAFTTTVCDGGTFIAIGHPDSTNATIYTVPLNTYYNYTLTETIIDSAEIGGPMELSTLAYYYDYSTAMTAKTNVTVWLQPTNKTEFTSETDIVVLDTNTAVQVYSGPMNCEQGWNYFGFTTPYSYNGQGNLLVIVDDNSGSYNSSSYVFKAQATSQYKSISWYSDSDNPDPTSNSYSGVKYRYQYRPVMQLISCGGCPAPVINTVSHDYESAIITVSGNGNGFELEYGTDPSIMPNNQNTTTNTFTLTGLQPATTYYFHVRQECDDNEMSNWTEGYFITDSLPCVAVTGLQVTGTSYNSISVSWTAGGDETAWEVKAASTVDSVTITATTTTATVDGLVPQRAYSVTVRPMCGNSHNIEGPWCDPETANTDICQPVSNVTVSGISATSATVAWTAPEGATNFRVLYGLHDFDVNGEIGSYTTTSNPFALTGLEANTPYTVRVAVACTETLVSAYESADFTTTDVGIFSADNDGALSLYPNPASTMVTLRVSEQLVGSTVSIVDVNGRVVMSEELNSQTLTLDLSEMAKGAYFVRITGDQATAVRKLIVK